MRNFRFSLGLIFALLAGLCAADITAAEKAQTIDELSKSLIARYVVKSKAEEVAALLAANLKSGAYDKYATGASFAKSLSEDVNGVCKDAHLRIRFSEKALPARKEATRPSPDEIAAQKRYSTLTNGGFEEVKRLGGNLGYIRFFGFQEPAEAERPLRAAMEFLKNTDALIFDIRENGGGDPETVALVCSYLFDKPTHINDILFREGDKTKTTKFVTRSVKGPKYLNKPVYLLVSKRTGSGAEEFAYDLQNQKRAVIIGENTWGGANPGGTVRLNDHFQAFIPVGMARNPITGTNWEGTGVTPDVKIAPSEALIEAQKMAIRKLLDTATGEDADRLKTVLTELENAKGQI